MIKQTKSNPWNIAELMRDTYQTTQIIDSMATLIIAHLIEPNKPVNTIFDLNRIVSTKYPEFKIENLDQKIFDKLKTLEMTEENIQSVIQMLNPYLGGSYDFSPNSVYDLAKFVKINELGKVADFNCNTSALLREVIKQNKFIGEVHLFSDKILSLKLSFVNIYPYNKNIVLHLENFNELQNCDQHFDFIYVLSHFGYKPGDEESLEIFEREGRRLLKKEGKMLLVVPAGFLFQINNKYNLLRKTILEKYPIDAIISLSKVFKPYTAIETALILLDNSKPLNQKVFVAHLNFIDDTFEDIKILTEAFFQHTKGKTIENVSPMTNRIEKQELQDDFNIKRFDPKQIRLNDKISKKYKTVFLDEVCNVIRGDSYGNNDY
ncbi:MAG: N-6 DNA methylase, partial [archaeon]|nr:N-6 DNA methylase [archaeon]